MLDWGYVAAGALTGFVVGLTGVGGGALMTPILLLFFGVAPTTAIATDLWFAAITKTAGARIHQAHGSIDWQVVRRLWCGSLPVAVIMVLYVSYTDAAHGKAALPWLTTAIGWVIVLTAVGMFLSPLLLRYARTRRISQPTQFKKFQPALTVLAGATLGFLVALTSVGAGALGSVMLLYLYPLRMTPHRLVATDIAHAIPLAIVAGVGYLLAGLVNWWMLFSLLTGSIPAVILGSILAKKMPSRGVQVTLAVILLSTGIGVTW